MYTEREYKFLRALFKLLKGKHVGYIDLMEYIKTKFRPISDKEAFEMAYLYDKNWSEGGFTPYNEDVIRKSYDDYMDSIPNEVKIMMEFKQDPNPKNFESDGYGSITYDGTEYRIYDDIGELMDIAIENADWICDDIDEWAESYVYMTDYNRSQFADEEAESYFNDLDDEEIIDRANIKDDIEELENLKNEPENKTEEEVEEMKQDLIVEERDRLKEEYRDEVYSQLENPVEYFVTNGIYNSVRQLVRSGPVEFDCDSAKNDYFDNADYENIVNSAGYNRYDTIIYGRREYFIVWD